MSIDIPTDARAGKISSDRPIRDFINGLAQIVYERIHEPIIGVVVAAPSCFTNKDCSELKTIIQQGCPNWQFVEIVDNLVAAGFGYAHQFMKLSAKELLRNILVVDFGAGKLDVGVIQIDGKGGVSVLSRSGNRDLGGRDIDSLLASTYRNGKVLHQWGTEEAFSILESCRKAKESLSTEMEAEIVLNIRRPRTVRLEPWKITRAELEKLCQPIFEEVFCSIRTALAAAQPKRIDDVLLLGGSMQIPALRKAILERFSRSPDERQTDLLVVQGAITAAWDITPKPIRSTLNIPPHSARSTPMDKKAQDERAKTPSPTGRNLPSLLEGEPTHQILQAVFISDIQVALHPGILDWLMHKKMMEPDPTVAWPVGMESFLRMDPKAAGIRMNGNVTLIFNFTPGTRMIANKFYCDIYNIQGPPGSKILCNISVHVEQKWLLIASETCVGPGRISKLLEWTTPADGVAIWFSAIESSNPNEKSKRLNEVIVDLRWFDLFGTVLWEPAK
jgi:actin-like ATPase involved in cell morphogenesis